MVSKAELESDAIYVPFIAQVKSEDIDSACAFFSTLKKIGGITF